MNVLKYNYHDASIEKTEMTPLTFSLYVDLYSILYPSKPKVKLSFRIVNDHAICDRWAKHLQEEFDEGENYLGARIGYIEIQETDMNIFLCKIKCNYMDVLRFKSMAFEELVIEGEIDSRAL